MCGGFVGDILDGIGDIVEDVGDFVGDTVEAVIDNPIGVLTSAALLYMGVPPVYAGAISGGVNAAATGGDVLKGALVGGAMAGAAGYAGNWAQASGMGTVAQAAAMGAAAGATGAALTGQGMQNVIRGALSGGVMGGALGYIQKPNGEITYTYDDGSTLTRHADGTYSSTPSGSIPAPVVDRSTYSTDKVNLSSSWAGRDIGNVPPGTVWTGASGPEIVLDGGKVLPLDVYRAAVALDKPIFVDGVAVSPQYADIATAGQGNYYDQSNINQLYRTPNTALATAEQINTGDAYYNPNARAWETHTVSATNADSQFIPKSLTSTGISDSAPGTIFQGPNGAEIVLDSGKTVNLAEYNAAAAEGRPFTVDNQWQMQFKIEVQGVPQYEGMPGAKPAPEGYRIARPEDVFGPDDTANASNPYKPGTYIDREANTWYTPIEPVAPTPGAGDVAGGGIGAGTGEITQPIQPVEITPTPNIPTVQPGGQTTVFDDGTWLTVMPDGSTSGIDINGTPFVRGPSTAVTTTPSTGGAAGAGGGGQTFTYDDGTTLTINPDGSITSTDTEGNRVTRTPAAGGGAGGGAGGTGPGTVTEPVMPSPDEDFPPTVGPVDETEFPHDRGTVPPDDTTTPTEPTTPTTPTLPIVPIVPPTTPTTPQPSGPGYTLTWGTPSPLQTNFGLNPGWIQPVAQYQTTSPVQSQFFWGAAPFQQGPTFNPQLAAQGVGAPVTPWGLQQMYQQLTPEQTAALVASSPYQSQLPGAQVAGPVAPT